MELKEATTQGDPVKHGVYAAAAGAIDRAHHGDIPGVRADVTHQVIHGKARDW